MAQSGGFKEDCRQLRAFLLEVGSGLDGELGEPIIPL